MSDIAWVCTAIVGAVFVWAGATKLQARAAWAAQARDMGAPAWAIPLTPFVELTLGAILILGWWPTLASSAGIALLIAFSWLISTNLVRGNRPSCACFGVRAARPITWLFVARNMLFIGLLLFALLVG